MANRLLQMSAGLSGLLPLKDKLSRILALSVEVIKLWQLPNFSVSLLFQMEGVGREGRGQAPLLLSENDSFSVR